MFHYCNNNNIIDVFNDEKLLNNDSNAFKRIKENMKEPVTPQTLKNIFSEIIKESKTSKQPIWSCCSCNELIIDKKCFFHSLDSLHENFIVLEEEKNQLTYSASVEIIKNHCQIFISSNKTWYYLNPDLVIDESKIILCEICSKNPIEYQFSIVNGHDCRRIGNLSELSNIAQNAISPVKSFGQKL